MKTLALIATLCLFSAHALADLYRCDVDGKPSYQDTPCSGGAKVKIILKKPSPPPPPTARLNTNATDPTADDRSAAHYRERSDVKRAKQIQQDQDSEREQQRSLAFQEEQARIAEHNAKVARCRTKEVDVQRMEADAHANKGDPWWHNRAVAEREKFRMECW